MDDNEDAATQHAENTMHRCFRSNNIGVMCWLITHPQLGTEELLQKVLMFTRCCYDSMSMQDMVLSIAMQRGVKFQYADEQEHSNDRFAQYFAQDAWAIENHPTTGFTITERGGGSFTFDGTSHLPIKMLACHAGVPHMLPKNTPEKVLLVAVRNGWIEAYHMRHSTVRAQAIKTLRGALQARIVFAATFLFGCRQCSGSVHLWRAFGSPYAHAGLRKEVATFAGVVHDAAEATRMRSMLEQLEHGGRALELPGDMYVDYGTDESEDEDGDEDRIGSYSTSRKRRNLGA